MAKRLFTSESVTEGHPDKVCDQISDAVLDDILAHDPNAHVACETFTTTGIVTVMGEITTKHYTDIPSIVRRTVERIGYTDPAYGFDYRSCAVMTAIDEQSPDIAMGVNESFELQEGGTDEADRIGAGDQGMMFGYACDETDVLMPAPIDLAHKLARQLTDVRKSGKLSWLRPDGKSQVTVEYGDDGKVLSCPAIVVSTQHDPDIALKELREAVVEEIIKPIIPAQYITKDTKFYVNPTGRFVVGGPVGDTGLTGRKIIVDTYGGSAAHGGGCFSGKDPTKVDRSAAYAARWVAKPGTSEHQTGLALDIVAASYQLLDEGQEDTAEQKWLMENSWKYGFILRYMKDKTDITGTSFEPWHYRYVGVEDAQKITAQGVCLEEYLGRTE